jgi:hypothetical protein
MSNWNNLYDDKTIHDYGRLILDENTIKCMQDIASIAPPNFQDNSNESRSRVNLLITCFTACSNRFNNDIQQHDAKWVLPQNWVNEDAESLSNFLDNALDLNYHNDDQTLIKEISYGKLDF